MKKLVWLWIVLAAPLLLSAQERIEKIEIIGNDRVTSDTITYYLSSRQGDYYRGEVKRKV